MCIDFFPSLVSVGTSLLGLRYQLLIYSKLVPLFQQVPVMCMYTFMFGCICLLDSQNTQEIGNRIVIGVTHFLDAYII